MSQALIGGSIDFSIQSADGLINMLNTNQPVIAFYAGFHQSDYAWLAQPAIKSWDALKGKTAGVSTFGSATDQLTRYALRRHGLVPEKDVQIVQAGPPASIAQALKSERLAVGILAPPMNWIVADAGLNILGSQGEEIAPQWPKHVFVARKKFLDDNPNTVRAILAAHVAAIRLARADRALVVATYMERLKFQKPYAERAYDAIVPGYDAERGRTGRIKSEHGGVTLVAADRARRSQGAVAERADFGRPIHPDVCRLGAGVTRRNLVGWVELLRNPSTAHDGFRIARGDERRCPYELNPSYRSTMLESRARCLLQLN